jgi:pyruvate kinase
VFAFTRHDATLRRVSMYRGVYAVRFDELVSDDGVATQGRIFDSLLQMGAIGPGDLVVLTKGQSGVSGRTNSMLILTVPGAPPPSA